MGDWLRFWKRGSSYASAVALTALAMLARWALPDVLGGTPYLAFFVAVVAAAAFCGKGPGVLATVLSLLCVDLLFDPTPGYIDLDDPVVLGRAAIFFAGGIGVSLVAGMYWSAQGRLREIARVPAESPEPVLRVSSSGELLYANREASELLTAMSWHGDQPVPGPLRSLAEEALRSGASVKQEVECVPGRILSFVVRPVAQMRYVNFYGRDVTDRTRAEQALQESETQFRTLANHISQLAWMADERGGVFWYNQRWYDYTGTTWEQMEGWGWQKVHHPDHVRRVVEKIRHCFETGEVWEDTFPLRGKDGSYRWFLSRAVPIRDAQGKVLRWLGTSTDVTAQQQNEEELRAARDSAERAKAGAEQANRAKDHFLAVLSHELRTPLTPVVMGVSLLQDRRDLDPAARETLEMIGRNVEMEAMLIDDLLDVSRIARGKVELHKKPVELCTAIQQAVQVCQPDIEARRLHFSIDLGPAAPYWVDADVSRLEQVFWNLLKNAIKFTPHDGYVGIRCWPSEECVVAEVTDSGIGMEPEAVTRVFNAFEQAERSITRQFGGLGLGLAISKALVELHGGRIEAHSEGRDKGATFRIHLPLTSPAGQPEAPAPPAPQRRAVRPLRILLVEDHGVTAKMMKMVLASEGHSVETAGDLSTALEMANRSGFDLLMADLGLPDGSGHDLLRQLRQRGFRFPGIALSGYGQEEDVQRSYEAGFAAHLTKPASREAVVKAIAAVVRGEPTTADEPTDGGVRKT
jgi:PAS domain S-box-containing protein